MSLPKKIRDWWGYLRSLNEKLDHTEDIILHATIGEDTTVESNRFRASSEHNYFCFAMMAYCEFVATTQVPQNAYVMDPAYRNPHMVTAQIELDVPEMDFFTSPLRL